MDDVLAELQIPRRTWQRWRELGTGPECIRLPNRDLRIRRTALNNWLESLKEAA
ncbi:helix-turn-helix transcriptional regulator [Kineosporia babensis]|uniref:helix-turn-helix transcriptional regulator n=1 Tax=Kineosporia babensis TaxID=499548 RepID=UPI0038B30A40